MGVRPISVVYQANTTYRALPGLQLCVGLARPLWVLSFKAL